MKNFIKILPLCIAFFSFLIPSTPVSASSYSVTAESEWTFIVSETQTVYIYGNSNEACADITTDPYLWLYNSSGTLVAQNDDGNHNDQNQCVSSKIVVELQPDTYTILAGYCCSKLGLGNVPGWGDGTYELVILDYDLSGGSPTTTTTSTTTTTVAPSIGPPMNLTGEVTANGVFLDWDAPNTGNTQPERYAISFRIPPAGGWGVATGNVGDANALNTEYTLPFSIFESTGGLGEEYVFDVRADNDTLGVYSGWSTQVTLTVQEPTPPTTTTTSTTTTTTTTLPPTTTTTTTVPTTTTTVAPTTTTSTSTTTTTTEVPPSTTTTSSTTTTTSSTTTSTTTTVPATTTTAPTTTAPTTTTTTTTTTTIAPVVTTTSTSSTTTVPRTTTTSSTTTTTTAPLTQEEALVEETKAEFEDLGIDTKGVDLIEVDQAEIKVIEQLDELDEELAEEFLDVVDGDITTDEIETLITNDNFEEISDDAQQILVQSLNEADEDVKEIFEEEVNIFSDADYGSYIPTGSTVNVEQRRVLIAAGATIMSAAAPAVGGGRKRK